MVVRRGFHLKRCSHRSALLETKTNLSSSWMIGCTPSSWDVFKRSGGGAEHTGPEIPLARRIYSQTSFGDVFWVADEAPEGYEHFGFRTMRNVSSLEASDVGSVWAKYVNTTPTSDAGRSNERSIYSLPSDWRQLVLLLRSSESPDLLLASRCTLQGGMVSPPPVSSLSSLPCRPGTGIIQAGLPTTGDTNDTQRRERRERVWGESAVSDAREREVMAATPSTLHCDWTAPNFTSIPDSHTRTCTSALPDGRIYLVGSQLPKAGDRDPLTLALSPDGLAFDKVVAVRANAPPRRYPGKAKGPGFQYPSAVWFKQEKTNSTKILFTYSVNKEDIEVSILDVSDLP
mmetsp:Transcript_6611/g.14553  ORF Transcript_6611/g.14553 Transcript_6611/m.14553 type:complete len:344 (-) Transcript_6611:38-1069(-)